MILNPEIPTEKKEFVFPAYQFQIDPPGESPFEALSPAALTQRPDNSFQVTWLEEKFEPRVTRAEAILENILKRSYLDVQRFPDNARMRANYGLALMNSGRLDEAADVFVTALDLAPQDFMVAANLARVRVLQGRLKDA